MPDSNTNFVGSQGYFRFAIKPKPGLANNTAINNKAAIEFGPNPAIITNTVLNTVVDSISSDESFRNSKIKFVYLPIQHQESSYRFFLTLLTSKLVKYSLQIYSVGFY
ncbi:MAG: hypothetical protein IPN54_02365 [Bacteroidetes bacterium]|nr:hypothetical protein [Bacteroidota bacterium]